jgi:nucleotide-binding universal stress UspA family protein
MTGRPATVIVDEAAAWGAELIVVGSRGLGRLGTMLLGSVSAEVVDHAPCPVLVTRSSAIRSILVAVDGSSSARQAVEHLAVGYLRGHPAEVLSVGPTHPSDIQADAIAAQAAEDLAADGYRVRWSICIGDPAHEIIEAAKALDADLIVLGSRGLTGLARLRLGSVARNVLLHTPASVLIVRGPVRVRSADRAEDSECIPAAAGSR